MFFDELKKNQLIVNKTVPISNVDGPGNRFAIFLQGCNLNCLYCHNPETINYCTSCGSCVKTCPSGALKLDEEVMKFDSVLCSDCGKCISYCKANATPKALLMSTKDLLDNINKYSHFISGITVSGGEATLQYQGLTDLFKKFKKKYPELTTFLDTNGYFKYAKIKSLLEFTDSVILDIKAFYEDTHFKLTGHSNELIVNNLFNLINCKKLYEVRTVICSPLIDTEKTVTKVASILNNSTVIYKLIKFRPMGVRKNICSIEPPSDDSMNTLLETAKKYHSNTTIV